MSKGLFEKGKSGNPAGRPKGATGKIIQIREMLKPHAPELMAKVVEMALAGDTGAMKLCLDRITPAIKPTAETMTATMPTTGTLAEQGAAIYNAAATGEVSLEEATGLMQVLAGQCKIIELSELTARLEALEESQKRNIK